MRAIQAWSGVVAIGASVLAVSSEYPTPVAQASSPAHTVSAQPPPETALTIYGNLGATMPAASISATDGLPDSLLAGRYYRVTVHVGVAGGQPPTKAELFIVGADHSACVTESVPSGAISALHCTFMPAAVGRTGLQVKVLVGTSRDRQIVATFDHVVVRTASPE